MRPELKSIEGDTIIKYQTKFGLESEPAAVLYVKEFKPKDYFLADGDPDLLRDDQLIAILERESPKTGARGGLTSKVNI